MANEIQTAPSTTLADNDDWEQELNLRELSMKGYDGISLTEWAAGDTDRPQIAAGSVIEIDGAIAKFTNQTAIADEGGITDGWCYIKFVVSGADVTPTLTNTFGTWDTAKQGFYTSGARFAMFAMYRSGYVTKIYTEKAEMDILTAKLGYWYYDKQYTGTVGGSPSYLISFTDSFFNASDVVGLFANYNIGGAIGYVNIAPTTYGITTIDLDIATTAGASGKPYGANIKYKLSL